MPTVRLTPSTYQLSSTSYLSISNASNMYTNTDSTTYATVTNSQNGTTSYYIYIRGFDFSQVPANAIIDSYTVKFKARESGVSTSTSYRPYLVNNTTAITSQCNTIGTSATTLTFTGVTSTWSVLKGYGSNLGIRINCRRNNRNTTAYMYIYGAELVVEYHLPVFYDVTTSATNCTITPSGTTNLESGSNLSIRIQADGKPTVTDNGVDVTNQLQSVAAVGYTVNSVSGTSYGFDLNASTGYYTSNNKAKATSAALCKVDFDLAVECTVTFSLINYAEATYDYGLLSNIDKTLSTSASADTSNVYWDGKNNNSASVQTVTYTIPAGEHYIYVKYFKDSYTDSNNDTLQFKVAITPNGTVPDSGIYEYTLTNIQGNHTIVAVYSAAADTLYIKYNGAWTRISKVYQKVNNAWVEVTNLSTVIKDGVNYVNAGG